MGPLVNPGGDNSALIESGPALFDLPAEREIGRGEFRGMEFLHVRARSLINRIKRTSGLPFEYTINAYRGCSHACTYCFARPAHEYLGLGIGEDFDRRVVVKVNAPEVLRAELAPRRWAGHHIAMGTNTDPYQRCEGKYRLTKAIVGELMRRDNPFSILTKSTLVLRDLDLLVEAARRADVSVNLSIGSLDERVWRLTEPGTPHPLQRVRAVARLREAGLRCGVLIAPVIPGLSDEPAQLERVVRACVDAGASSVHASVLHLRPGVREHLLGTISAVDPVLAARLGATYRSVHAPTEIRRTVGAEVAVLLRRFGGPTGTAPSSWRTRPERVRPVDRPGGRASSVGEAPEQLALGFSACPRAAG